MEDLPCHVLFLHRVAGEDRLVSATPGQHTTVHVPDRHRDRLRQLVQPLLDAFGDVHVCATGKACLTKLFQFYEDASTDLTPTLVIFDTPHDDRVCGPRSSPPDAHALPGMPRSPPRLASTLMPDQDLYGLTFLQKLITEAHLRNLSKIILPIPIISYPGAAASSLATAAADDRMTDGTTESVPPAPPRPLGTLAAHRQLVRQCLDLGAVDVIISPLNAKCITTLEISAFKAHRDVARDRRALLDLGKVRKRSWVGLEDQKPFAYLREAMVSSLMNGICCLDSDDTQVANAHVSVSSERQALIVDAVARWHFCAHAFSDDELLIASLIMFTHALQTTPELDKWCIHTDQLIRFLVACRAAYNSFVPYHNFRHVVDVLQATFHFLLRVGALPPTPHGHPPPSASEKSTMAALVSPFEALTLMIAAIGHDVGHPGVNNGFLSKLNAPLAQLYNDRSVLESFHCAAYSQILRRYWPAAFSDDNMRNLMISSILATDMGLHLEYMDRLVNVQEQLQAAGAASWDKDQVKEHKALVCSLLIKCADISNVARHHDTALQWMHILAEEFSRQASMETELKIESSLMAQPKKDILSLANAQLGFMDLFATPLFRGVADIMPTLRYTVVELDANKNLFERKVEEEKVTRRNSRTEKRRSVPHEEPSSPKTRAPPPRRRRRPGGGDAGPDPAEGTSPAGTASPASLVGGRGEAPHVLADVERHNAQPFSPLLTPSPARAASAAPDSAQIYRRLNGLTSTSTTSCFDAARDVADGDPFRCRPRDDSGADSSKASAPPHGRHRCSETTEGSASGAFAGNWQSQATTSGTTGKLALLPSTRGTSIISNESLERTVSASERANPLSSSPSQPPQQQQQHDPAAADEDSGSPSHEGSPVKADPTTRTLKKRSSRFRMRDFPFFRKNRGTSPQVPAADVPR